jgi:hypothetical protein
VATAAVAAGAAVSARGAGGRGGAAAGDANGLGPREWERVKQRKATANPTWIARNSTTFVFMQQRSEAKEHGLIAQFQIDHNT